jgi:nicotinamide phosphoribosyltransferase
MGLAKVVFRPDSGDPVKVICGDTDAEPGSPAYKGAVECLWEIFGGEVTDEGYKILNERVGVIYGDSITLQRAQAMLEGLAAKGFASNNIVFGIGSFTYQYLTRDNFGFALKATWGQVNGEAREIFKDPITDNGEKKSARGLLRVEETENGFEMFDQQTAEQEKQGAFKVVFEDGKLIIDQSLTEIRARLIR